MKGATRLTGDDHGGGSIDGHGDLVTRTTGPAEAPIPAGAPGGGGEAVPAALAAVLRCGSCGAAVWLSETEAVCPDGHRMVFTGGYLDGSRESGDEREARTLRSFGYEWTSFHAVQPEDEEFWHRYFADVDLAELADRLAIDVGCGKGRYTRFTAGRVRAMIALDGSDAVRSAVANLHDLPNSLVVKAPIDFMPVAEGCFGLVSCLGVLHHLADPRAGFDRVARLLEPGGVLLVYLYSRPERRGPRAAALAAARMLRRVSVRLPHRLLKPLCAPIALTLYALFVVPGHSRRRLRGGRRTPPLLGFYHGKPLRSLWLDTFDRLSAPIEHRYVWSELEPWFTSAGLSVQSVREENGLFIVARRPV